MTLFMKTGKAIQSIVCFEQYPLHVAHRGCTDGNDRCKQATDEHF